MERDWEVHWGREKKYTPHLDLILRSISGGLVKNGNLRQIAFFLVVTCLKASLVLTCDHVSSKDSSEGLTKIKSVTGLDVNFLIIYIYFFKLILIRKLFEIQLSLFTLAHFNKNTNVCLSTNGLLKLCFKMLQNKKRIMNIQIKIFFLNNWINKKKNPPALKLKYFCILVLFFVTFYLFVVSFILWPLSSVWFFKHLLWLLVFFSPHDRGDSRAHVAVAPSPDRSCLFKTCLSYVVVSASPMQAYRKENVSIFF